jgi:hypothetical protein
MESFSVSSSGSRVQTALGPDSLLSIDKPLTKLDTTNKVSFQTISILFNREPPQPTASSYTNTVLYKTEHGYKNYIPSTWMSWQNPAPSPTASPSVPGNHALRTFAFGDDTNSVELLGDIHGAVPGIYEQTLIGEDIYNDAGILYLTTIANLVLTADDTNIYLSVLKENVVPVLGVAPPIHLAGITLNVRVYVFSEPATTSDY